MKKILAILGALIVAATVAFAHPVPIYKGKKYRCEESKGNYLTVWMCGSPRVNIPDPREMAKMWMFMERTYKMKTPLETTITIVHHSRMTERARGLYFPSTGQILVTYLPDEYMMAYVMSHEMLHFYWHQTEPGTPFGEHHQRIYCQDKMKPVEEYLQKASPRHRVYISPMYRTLICSQGTS